MIVYTGRMVKVDLEPRDACAGHANVDVRCVMTVDAAQRLSELLTHGCVIEVRFPSGLPKCVAEPEK